MYGKCPFRTKRFTGKNPKSYSANIEPFPKRSDCICRAPEFAESPSGHPIRPNLPALLLSSPVSAPRRRGLSVLLHYRFGSVGYELFVLQHAAYLHYLFFEFLSLLLEFGDDGGHIYIRRGYVALEMVAHIGYGRIGFWRSLFLRLWPYRTRS